MERERAKRGGSLHKRSAEDLRDPLRRTCRYTHPLATIDFLLRAQGAPNFQDRVAAERAAEVGSASAARRLPTTTEGIHRNGVLGWRRDTNS